MFENSKIPAGGIIDDLHIPTYDLYSCNIPSFFNLEINMPVRMDQTLVSV